MNALASPEVGAATPAAAALSNFADPRADSVAALAALFDFVRPDRREPTEVAAVRFAAVVARAEADPALAAGLRQHVVGLFGSSRLVAFFADSGILPATGFFSELGRIVANRLLPEPPDEGDLRQVLWRVFHRRGDWVWLQSLPPEHVDRFWALVIGDLRTLAPFVRRILDQMIEAMLVVSYRVGGIDVDAEFGRLGSEFRDSAPRFRALTGAAQRFADGLRAGRDDQGAVRVGSGELAACIGQCQEVIARARRVSLRMGTSLRLTYTLRRTAQSLQRLADLGYVLDLKAEADRPADLRTEAVRRWSAFVGAALADEGRRHSISSYLSSGLSMLASRVTGNAAKTGEHYVADTRADYIRMWRAAMGAGLVIGGMALLKVFTSALPLSLAGFALLYSLDYGLGFVLIYMLHFTVATKQPAMTAQTIAGYLGEAQSGRVADLERVVDLIAAVSRTQIAAVLGNVLAALPAAIGVSMLLERVRGVPTIDFGKAAHLLDELSIAGWALPHAALAGVFLFLAGVLSGYFDNLASYARVQSRIARLPWLVSIAGAQRAEGVGAYVEEHLGGLMGNFLFGCMLGTAGVIGTILGLPIDIRHVAFAAANLGYALVAFDFAMPWQTAAWAALGVAMIGLTNLTVSFALALWMAVRARGVAFTQSRELFARLWRRFRAVPSSFVSARGLG